VDVASVEREPQFYEFWAESEASPPHLYRERTYYLGGAPGAGSIEHVGGCGTIFVPRLGPVQKRSLWCRDCLRWMMRTWTCEECEAPADYCACTGCSCDDAFPEFRPFGSGASTSGYSAR
jgi:hypothetical protein